MELHHPPQDIELAQVIFSRLLTKEVLKAMLFSKIKTTTAAVLALLVIGGGLWQACIGAKAADDNSPVPAREAARDGTYRVTVNELIRDDATLVTEVDIEAPRGFTVELIAEKDKREAAGSTLSLGPSSSNGPGHTKLILFADHIEGKAGTPSLVKFMLQWKGGKISSSTSESDPLPAGARQLADILTVPIKSGQYPCGQATKLATFKGRTYSLVVNKSK
jgi:hypothetical protein